MQVVGWVYFSSQPSSVQLGQVWSSQSMIQDLMLLSDNALYITYPKLCMWFWANCCFSVSPNQKAGCFINWVCRKNIQDFTRTRQRFQKRPLKRFDTSNFLTLKPWLYSLTDKHIDSCRHHRCTVILSSYPGKVYSIQSQSDGIAVLLL